MAVQRDIFTGFKFYDALAPQAIAAGGAINGATIDLQGYTGCTFVVNIGQYTGGGAFSTDNRFQLMLEHAYESAAGSPSVWSEVYPSQMLHSVTGEAGAYSTLNSGIFQSITSADVSTIAKVGYIGPRRLVRIRLSDIGAPSTMSFAAIAILGIPHAWGVQEPASV